MRTPNEAETQLALYMARECGSFVKHLFDALFAADSTNLALLGKGFPDHAEAVHRWRSEEGYSTFIRSLL